MTRARLTRRGAPLESGALPARASWVFVTAVVACAVLYTVAPESPAGTVAALAVPLGGIAAVGLGLRRNRPDDRRPWRLVQGGMSLAFLGAAIRRVIGSEGPGTDVIVLAAYALLFASLLSLQRARDREAQADVIADGVLVGMAAALLAWTLLVSPALSVGSAPLVVRVVENLYPVLDAALLFMILRVAFVSSGNRALWLMGGGFACLLVGDLLWAVDAVRPLPLGDPLLEAPYLGCYGLVGAGVLHPSMRVLTTAAQPVIRPLARGRLVAVSLAVAVPALLVFARPLTSVLDRTIFATGLLLLAAIAGWRTTRAVNQHAASELRLAHLATHDALTGLPNRTRLVEWLESALAGDPRDVAVLFCDLDGFKYVNDSWGHSVGDELLRVLGQRLSEAGLGADRVARIGGDEFVLTCSAADTRDAALGLADRVLAQAGTPFILSVGEVFVSASIGIVLSSDHAGPVTPEELIRDADIAMYQAKGEGRNRAAVFDEAMRRSVTHRTRTESELRHALERDELLVHYQPIVNVADGALEGLEALVRWDHPERGLVPPGDFIPVVEDSDLILPLGEFVLRRAAAQVRRWRAELDHGGALQVSVNVAARQLRDPSFLDMLRDVLDDNGLPGEALTLEITESTMLDDSEATMERLTAIRQLGVGLSVDDFGTGYSSLKYLKKFPVTTVKIDRAFVDGLGSDPDAEVIVQAVLAMGHALGLQVVAEGVETILQRDRLIVLGCDSAQGYLFGRPAPASAGVLTGVSGPPLPASPSGR
jgi:diguanylate cyclase (GGDEF)-like protein